MQPASTPETFVFLLLSALAVGLALFTITRRNPVVAVMSLVGTFVALSGVYATLSAHFLAVMQVMVYAGAIMVLFIFVVMILNRDEISPVGWRGVVSRSFGVIATGWAFAFLTTLAVRAARLPEVSGRALSEAELAALPLAQRLGIPAELPEGFGTVGSVGRRLFTEYVFPFEAISVLLLIAIVGGLVVSRSARQEQQAEAAAERVERIRAQVRPEPTILGDGPSEASGSAHGHAAGGHP